MSLSSTQRTLLEKRAAKNQVRVETLLRLLDTASRDDIEFIEKLRRKSGWKSSGLGPLGAWCDVVCAYLLQGTKGVVALATAPDSCRKYFSIGVSTLAHLRSDQAVLALLRLAEVCDALPLRSRDIAVCHCPAGHLAYAFNLLLNLRNPVEISDRSRRRVRTFLTRAIQEPKNAKAWDEIGFVLRCVGNSATLKVLDAIPDFEDKDVVAKAIRERLSQQGAKR